MAVCASDRTVTKTGALDNNSLTFLRRAIVDTPLVCLRSSGYAFKSDVTMSMSTSVPPSLESSRDAVRRASAVASLPERYRIEREIGRGGMATVYLAADTKHDRPVAIKVMNSELSASLGTERFLREITIAARLAHPHIVPLIDSGEADGLLYYVSPFVPEGSLRERLRSEGGRLPLSVAIRIAREVGSGLDYMHRNGIIHRDVKPENILFSDGLALISDFGIAYVCQASDTEPLTLGGLVMGTPAYMSPEQASGSSGTGLESRSDVYSLACVLFEMLSGAPPFVGENARATMAKHVTEQPPSIRLSRPEVRSSLDAALMKALAKNPDERFATVAEFVTALEADRTPMGRSTAARTKTIAVLPFVNASPDPDNEYLSDGITDELIAALARVEGLRVSSRTSVFALKGKPQDVRAIGVLLGATVVLEGTLRRVGDQLRITAQLTSTDDGRLMWSERYDRRLDDVFALQDEIASTIVSALRTTTFADLSAPRRRPSTPNMRAYSLYLRGRFEWNKRTQEGVQEGIRYFEQAIAEDPKYAAAYTGLADSYALQVDYRSVPVADGFARAKAYARQAIALQDTLAEAHASLAWSLFIHDWNWAESEREFRRAIELDPQYATGHQWFAFQLASQGKFDEALVEAHTAHELDPSSISVRRSLAWVYFYSRRFDQAVYHLERAVALNPTAEETYRVLGMSLAYQGATEEAERVLREGLELPGAGTYSAATLGYVLARSGKRDEASQILAGLDATRRLHYVSPTALAHIHLGLGNWQTAVDWAERAVAERRGWPVYFKVNPVVEPIREDPRFIGLMRRMGL
jgi:serine/threonine-protein kinase